MTNTTDKRWIALFVLCLGTLMIVLDTTIVNVALPSIRTDLGFSESSLAWVVNAYLLIFGGFLLLSGRLGDFFGHRRLFLIGISLFTLASLACGLAFNQWFLIAARAIQGLGGAIVSAVGLSLTMSMFVEPAERSKAMGYFGFVAAGGGAVGVLLGGLLTSVNWHWIFLVNIPIGLIVIILSFIFLPAGRGSGEARHIDFLGAAAITTSMLLAVYAIVGGNDVGWLSLQTIALLIAALVLLALFIWIEGRVREPLMPLSLFQKRNIIIANSSAVLWAAAMFAWFFISALYLQLVLNYTPLQVGLAFLPANIIMGIFSFSLSAKLVMRFGIKKPLIAGLSLAAVGLALLSLSPVTGSYVLNVLPSMLLLGIGAGIAFNPMLLAAMSDVAPSESGLASGIVNTSFLMGGALGLAVLASLAAGRTMSLIASGADQLTALNSGYHAAFIVGAIFAAVGAALGATLRHSPQTDALQMEHVA